MKVILIRALRLTMLSPLTLCVVACLQVCCTSPQLTAGELDRLQGTWKGIKMGGKSNDTVTIVITGDRLHFQEQNPEPWYEAIFTLPTGTSPQQLRATITSYQLPDSVGTESIGAVIWAIFKIEDGILTLAAGGSEEPPKTFPDPTHGEQSSASCYVLKKVQPQKKNIPLLKPK